MPINTDEIGKVLTDVACVTIGLGLMAFQRAQVRRREVIGALAAQLAGARDTLDRARADLEGQRAP